MCGSLRRENMAGKLGTPNEFRPGSEIEVFNPKTGMSLGKFRWRGFARGNKLDTTWTRYNPQEALILVNSYTEKGAVFQVPEGKAIRAIVANDPQDAGYGDRVLKIVTRGITREENIETLRQGKIPHHRHPEMVDISEAVARERILNETFDG